MFKDLKYDEEQLKICLDFNMLQILMGLRSGGNIRHPCAFVHSMIRAKKGMIKLIRNIVKTLLLENLASKIRH